jgi:hypothetical protein
MALKLGPITLPFGGRDSHKDDPYWDFFLNVPPADLENSAVVMMDRAPEGNIFPTQAELHSPEITSSHVKELGLYLGAQMIAVARLSSTEHDYPFGIITLVEADYDTTTHQGIGGQVPTQHALYVTFVMSAWIRELGYRATAVWDPHAEKLAAQARLGTLNAQNRLVTPQYGPRVHVGKVIRTDLPLAADG